jgi:restriction system protein
LAVEEAPKSSPASAGFSFTDCAQKVLEEFGGKKPMHYKEITEKALGMGIRGHLGIRRHCT